MVDEHTESEPPRRGLRLGPALGLLGVVPFLIAGLRLVQASHEDPTVLNFLTNGLDLQALLLSTYAPVLPVLLVYAVVVLSILRVQDVYVVEGPALEVLFDLLALLALYLLVFEIPVLALLVYAGLGALLGLSALLGHTRWWKEQAKRTTNRQKSLNDYIGYTFGLTVLIQAVFFASPWLPTDRLALQSGGSLSVEVVRTQLGSLTVIDLNTNRLHAVATSDMVGAPQPCRPTKAKTGWLYSPVLSVTPRTQLPTCPKNSATP